MSKVIKQLCIEVTMRGMNLTFRHPFFQCDWSPLSWAGWAHDVIAGDSWAQLMFTALKIKDIKGLLGYKWGESRKIFLNVF